MSTTASTPDGLPHDAEEPGWRQNVSFIQRLDSIDSLHGSSANGNGGMSSSLDKAMARAKEQKIFDAARSLDSYLAAIRSESQPVQNRPEISTSCRPPSPPLIPGWARSLPPLSFSSKYRHCIPFARGVSSTVYIHLPTSTAIKVVDQRPPAPHSAAREVAILKMLKGSEGVIDLCDSLPSATSQGWNLVVMPYQPLSLSMLLDRGPLTNGQRKAIFRNVFAGLEACHSRGIIHRDIKPASVLLSSPQGPAYLADFGIAYHPAVAQKYTFTTLLPHQPSDVPGRQILDIGTGPYRCPDALFGNMAYGPELDMWAAGATLAEAVRDPPVPLFASPDTHEDGSQLGLIQSIFRTLGTPTPETWPEAEHFPTRPWDMWEDLEGTGWEVLLEGADAGWRDMVAALVVYSAGGRMTAAQAGSHQMLATSEEM